MGELATLHVHPPNVYTFTYAQVDSRAVHIQAYHNRYLSSMLCLQLASNVSARVPTPSENGVFVRMRRLIFIFILGHMHMFIFSAIAVRCRIPTICTQMQFATYGHDHYRIADQICQLQ